jgi:hypothetical protein
MARGKRVLEKSFYKAQEKKQDNVEYISGILGFYLNGGQVVEVPDKAGYVYVRIRNNLSEVVKAYNETVSTTFGLPVLLARDKKDKRRWRVSGRDLGTYVEWGDEPYLPLHGSTHSFRGGDMTWVYSEQLLPLVALPSGTSTSGALLVHGRYPYYWNSEWKYFGTTSTVNLLDYKPTGSFGKMVLIYLDQSTNELGYEEGSYFSESITGASQVVQQLPSLSENYYTPIAGVRLVSGTTSFSWDNIYDVRPWLNDLDNVTGSFSGHTIQEDSVDQTSRTNLNFMGDGFEIWDDAGNDATIVSGTISQADIITAHNELTGLDADDHTQYVLRQPTANTVINESGGDFDFRIEGDAEENLFFLDAGNNRIGFGTASPDVLCDIETSTLGDGAIIGECFLGNWNDVANYAVFSHKDFRTSDSNTKYAFIQKNDGIAYFNGVDNLYLAVNGMRRVFVTVNSIQPFVDNAYDIGSSSYRWDDIFATNGTIQTSDADTKDNVEDSDLGLDFVIALRPVKYKWKDYIQTITDEQPVNGEMQTIEKQVERIFTRPHYGLIAQDIEQLMVDKGIDDFAGFIKNERKDKSVSYGLRYHEFIAPMIKAIQEQQTQIDDLVKRIEKLEAMKE